MATPIQPTIGIKLKIPKEKLNNCISLEQNSKKRERDKSSPIDLQPAKIPKLSLKESKQNGRHTYSKVSTGSTAPTSYPSQRFARSPKCRQQKYLPPHPQSSSGILPLMSIDPMIPPPPNSMYFYPRMTAPPPPPPPPSLPNMSVPPPNYLYPYYPGYVYPAEFYVPPLLPSNENLNPPLPTEAPPLNLPPPPPPE